MTIRKSELEALRNAASSGNSWTAIDPDDLLKLLARHDAMEKALEPFALASKYSAHENERAPITASEGLSLSRLRDAAAAVAYPEET